LRIYLGVPISIEFTDIVEPSWLKRIDFAIGSRFIEPIAAPLANVEGAA
jgi:hypothetical protein